jgi:hypothetical protein
MTRFKSIKELMEYIESLDAIGHGYAVENFTCYNCDEWYECPYAFDAYSTDGECLRDK